ncbi:hypothetical protein [Haliangium ochraceum]|uniref:Uncharacterized protein n=1 Tax=Haliangium ochraceum (strain DSM 14365 / JCM 11303 / SMP-2) TaxID=502025 RepID=D0LQM1_HALO1|nr:hypothetical protein [Haliangium ochraceum]ACY13581.1 hypothetical protein Hoch_0980 [Haliangium ochraceum DSM 14365]
MVNSDEYLWRPSLEDPAYWRGAVVAAGEHGEHGLRRAPWSSIAACLAGNVPSSWASVRCVRLDGPRATDETLRTLAEQGALDQVTRLELASSAFSAQALQIALALPALESLRCESLTVSDCADTQTASLQRLEFRDCAGATCRALIRAAPNAKVVEIALLEPKRDAAAVHDELGNLSLRGLHLRHQSCTRRHLEAALRSSHETLKALTLDSVSGLESDQFLASVDWSALATLSIEASKLKRIEGHLPETLCSLSLARSQIVELRLGDSPWSTNLQSIDLVGQPLTSGLVERLSERSETLHGLGLGSSEAASRVLAAYTEPGSSRLRELKLGEGTGVGEWTLPAASQRGERWPALERLRVVGQMPVGGGTSGWRVDERILSGLLCGESAPALRALALRNVAMGNPQLAGGLSNSLHTLTLESCTGFLEGLAGGEQSRALVRLALDGVEVAEDELGACLASCSGLRSLGLSRIPGFGPDGLAVALRSVADTLLQLALEGFRADGDEAYAREWSSALGATRLPALSELAVDDVSMNAEALTRLLNDRAPQLQRLAFDLEAMGQDAWLTLAEHATADLHWIAVSDSGTREELAWLLDDPESRISSACVSLS